MGSVTTAIETRDSTPATVSPRQAIVSLVEKNKNAIGLSLPRNFDQDRFTRLLITAGNTNPDLFTCTPGSFLAAGIGCAQLGLEPNDARGLAYLIPFKERKKDANGQWTEIKKVTLILGYRGMMDLARRSGMVSSINAFPVYAGDDFTYQLGLEPTLHHIPGDHDENPNDLTHVYAVAKVQGDPQFVVLTRKQVERVRAQSQGARSDRSPWNTHYVEMALKSAIRRLCKFLPQTVEMAQAMTMEDKPLTLSDVGALMSGDDEGIGHDDALDVESHETGDPAA